MARALASTRVAQMGDFMTNVFAYALSGEGPNERQQLRLHFAPRCKLFNRIVTRNFDYFDVFGTEGMVKAFHRLDNPADRDNVSRVYLQLASTYGKNKGDKFRELMSRLRNAQELEFVVSAKNLDTLERSLVSGLGGLTKMRSLILRPHKHRELPLLDSSILGVVAMNWRELRTLSLSVRIAWPAARDTDVEGAFNSLRRLHSLELRTTDHDLDRLFNSPPASLKTVTISYPDLYIQDAIPFNLYNALAVPLPDSDSDSDDGREPTNFKMKARHITALVLRDPPGPNSSHIPVRSRARFYDLLESLVDLRSLTCAPCAVDLLVALALMPSLRELTLVEDRAKLSPPLQCTELIDLLSQGTLRRVSIGASIRRGWSAMDQARAESLAFKHGCEVVWL